MTPGARAIVEYLAEQLAKDQLERQAAEIDRTRNAEQNAPHDEKQTASA